MKSSDMSTELSYVENWLRANKCDFHLVGLTKGGELAIYDIILTLNVAKAFLSVEHGNNRNHHPTRVKELASDIAAGDFAFTDKTISFDWDFDKHTPTLVDGGFRNEAVVDSGKPIHVLAAFGNIPIGVLDNGKVRNARDTYHIEGRMVTANYLALVRVPHYIDSNRFTKPVSTAHLKRIEKDYQTGLDWASQYLLLRAMRIPCLGALAWAYEKQPTRRADIEKFTEQVAEYFRAPEDSLPAYEGPLALLIRLMNKPSVNTSGSENRGILSYKTLSSLYSDLAGTPIKQLSAIPAIANKFNSPISTAKVVSINKSVNNGTVSEDSI